MSEVRYRAELRQILAFDELDSELSGFVGVLLESMLPIPEQLRIVLDEDLEGAKVHAIVVIGTLQIHQLVPFLIHIYKALPKTSLFPFQILGTLVHLKHELLRQFLLDVLQDTQLPVGFRMRAVSGIEGSAKSLAQVLLPLLKDDDYKMRLFALQRLGVLGDASLASYLEPLLTDTAPAISTPTIGDYARQILEKWASEETNQDKTL
jgi:hypothetical protein